MIKSVVELREYLMDRHAALGRAALDAEGTPLLLGLLGRLDQINEILDLLEVTGNGR